MKINKTMIISIFFLVLMGGSTLAYGVLQSLSTITTQPAAGPELPTQNIIDYSLSAEQRRALLRLGKTIVEIDYSLACEACKDTRSQLEAATQEFSDQLLLVELVVGDSADLPLVRIESSYGKEVLGKPTNDEIMNTFCDLFVSPPLRCATRNV